MNKQDRMAGILQLTLDQGSVSVEQIVSEFGVSHATARRDLDTLSEQQLVQRTRGGARSNPTSGDVPLRYRSSRRAREKVAIAQMVASMVRPGEVIGFNGGTTTTAAAQEVGVMVAGTPAFNETPLTVVTNAVNIANDLTIRGQVRVVLTGGVARTRSFELVGPLAELILPSIRLDTLFLGVNTVDLKSKAYYTHTEDEASINAAMVRAAERVVVLADSSKLGRVAFARICSLASTAALITDSAADPAHVEALLAHGLDVIIS